MLLRSQDSLSIQILMVEVNCVQRSGMAKMTYLASKTHTKNTFCKPNMFFHKVVENNKTNFTLGLLLYFFSLGFDLISQFQIDKAASQRTIQRVEGSTTLQVAYKLGNNVDFRIPTR